MAIPTSQAEQYSRLRAILTPYIKGPNVDAVLNALALGSASYLINNVSYVNDQLYIVSASGQYLDERLAQYGISRPANVGLADDVFSQIGIEIKNRKQVRDLINQLLDAIFGDEFVRASNDSSMVEPYALQDGDTLIVNFDAKNTVTVTFNASQFNNIAEALAQEVADVISSTLNSQGIPGSAISNNNGNGNYVELLSNTIGPASSVTVMGGSAQNELIFPSIVPAGGNLSTQWTLTLQPGGFVRFTWSGGADPKLGKVSLGNYVNIFGGGFASSTNEGSFSISKVLGGDINVAYFEVQNPVGTSGVITQGTDNAILFYNSVKQTILSNQSYAAIFQTQPNILQVFLPATTKVVRRSRIGSAHIHYPSTVSYVLNAQPSFGDIFQITSAISLTAGSSFTIAGTLSETAENMASALSSDSGMVAIAGNSINTDGNSGNPIVTIQQDDPTLTLVGTYSGLQNIVASGLQGDPTSEISNQQGPYSYDTTQSFNIGAANTVLTATADSNILFVEDSSQFPDSQGYVVLGLGTENQEGPIPYISVPSNNTILLSPVYTLKNYFPTGTTVFLSYNNPVQLTSDGTDYPFYVTDVVSGREYVQTLINTVAATGITVIFTVLYPSDIGLGKGGTPYSEISYVYGP